MTTKTGIFAGTFDPIHEGHIAFAESTIKVCGLEKVVFLPEGEPRLKQQVTPLASRLRHISATLKPYPLLGILELKTRNFTVSETLPMLQKFFPDDELVFLLGSDVALGLHKWPHVDKLITSTFAIGLRTRQSEKQIDDYMNQLGSSLGRVINYQIIRTPHSDKASSQYRNIK